MQLGLLPRAWCVKSSDVVLFVFLTECNGQASREREHARGLMDKSTPEKLPPVIDLQSLWQRLPLLDFSGQTLVPNRTKPSDDFSRLLFLP